TPPVRDCHPGSHWKPGHRPRDHCPHQEKRHGQVLWGRYHAQAQTVGQTGGRQEADETGGPGGDSAGSFSGGPGDGPVMTSSATDTCDPVEAAGPTRAAPGLRRLAVSPGRRFVEIAVLCTSALLVFRTLAIESYIVPTGSMAP